MRQLWIALAALVVVAAGFAVYLRMNGKETPAETGAVAAAAEMCAEHGVPEADCPFCDPGLVERRGMCREHGVPEALCVTCNPALETAFRAEGDWCAGHGVPESQCVKCGHDPRNPGAAAPPPPEPELGTFTVERRETPRTARAPSVTCDTESLVVRLADPDVVEEIGLATEPVTKRPIRRVLDVNAQVDYDRNRYARVSPRAPGVVRKVAADLGDEVEAGDTLAVVDSQELGSAKADLLSSLALVSQWEKNRSRERELLEKGVSTEKELLAAETALTESRVAADRARQRLTNLGLSEEEVDRVVESRDTSSLLPLAAPFAGVVVRRDVAPGEMADTSRALFTVSDVSRMWAVLDVSEADAVRLKPGLAVKFAPDGLPGRFFPGSVTFVGTEVDRHTRTVRVRAELMNPEGTLRANMYGRATVVVADGTEAPVVPKDAVQWEGCCNVVFVAGGGGIFYPRKVRLGAELGRFYEVLEGVTAGEPVVTSGSFLMKTEILKGSIGAGCCEPNPGSE